MPATSLFKIPNTPRKQNQFRVDCDVKGHQLMVYNKIEPNFVNSYSYQIIQVDRHRYSMIKYTKMVTNVTFK